MSLIDTHAHIHSADYTLDADEVLDRAQTAGVDKIICVGTDEKDSALAIEFAKSRPNVWASVGLHPHDAKLGDIAYQEIDRLAGCEKVVAVGECGLDFYYNHSAKKDQVAALHAQIQTAISHNLPLIFHIRDAFEDFWPVFDQYDGLKGVVHSFTAGQSELDEVLSRGLLVGFNGIMTFSRDQRQLAAAKACPTSRIVLETDAPFLTPVPKRGTVNESANVRLVGQFLSDLRGESFDDFTTATTKNARKLFNI